MVHLISLLLFDENVGNHFAQNTKTIKVKVILQHFMLKIITFLDEWYIHLCKYLYNELLMDSYVNGKTHLMKLAQGYTAAMYHKKLRPHLFSLIMSVRLCAGKNTQIELKLCLFEETCLCCYQQWHGSLRAN